MRKQTRNYINSIDSKIYKCIKTGLKKDSFDFDKIKF